MTDDRLSGNLDAVLHLLDRQVVDVDGLMVCKVDDLEITVSGDGTLGVTALLAGPAALVPRYADERLGRVLHEFWRRLGPEQSDRDAPYRIDLGLVHRLRSGVELNVPREGVLVRESGTEHRLNDLLQMPVHRADDGVALGRVLDVRLARETTDPGERIRVVGLVVGRGRPGSYLGYDRRPGMGPWLVGRVIRWLHRHSGYLPIESARVEWGGGSITADVDDLHGLEPV